MLEQIRNTKEKFLMTDRTAYTQNRQKFLEQNIKGVNGSTWDATHLTSFLNKSFYSNKKSPQKEENTQTRSYSLRRKKSGDYFFKNLRYDENKSHIGYSKVNPMISNIQVSKQRQKALVDFFLSRTQKMNDKQKRKSPQMLCDQNSKFKFQGNSVKFRATNPLTSRYQPQKPQRIGYSIQRMKKQISSRYPHGITGLDNPGNLSATFYEQSQQKPPRVKIDPLSQTSFDLVREWKTKKRVLPISQEFRFRHGQCIRKFRNQNQHGYNILTNRNVQEGHQV